MPAVLTSFAYLVMLFCFFFSCNSRKMRLCGSVCLGLCFGYTLQKNNYTVCNHSSNVVVRDFAQTLLSHFPKNSIVLTKGDLPSNSLRSLLWFDVIIVSLMLLFRVTTCLENLEMSGNLKHVREMSGMLLTVREMSGKKFCHGKIH